HGRILNPIGYHRAQESHWGQQIGEARHSYAELGYAVISGIIAPLQVSFMRSYQRSKESEGYWAYDNYKANERFFLHNDPQLKAIHRQTGRLVRSIIQSELFPSYSFMSAYTEGARLSRHVDRPQCKWNGSLLLDQRPEVSNEDSWPIYLDVEGTAHEVKLDMGDIVFFSGTDIPHWRNKIQDGHRQTLGLFHYVPIDFTGSLT
ncbi:MAG: hypothetical protein AAF202_14060, partial [Pseudomonadota bacterium]